MYKLYLLLLLILGFQACSTDFKKCDFVTKNEMELVYNCILDDLVQHYFYNHYLGEEAEELSNKYLSENRDTAKIRQLKISFHNEIFNNESKQCNIYLDTILKKEFSPWSYYINDTSKYSKEIGGLILEYSKDGQDVIDSLNTYQSKLGSNNYYQCTSNVLPISKVLDDTISCQIGIFSLSNIFYNDTKDKGILYCDFKCGGLCGFGRILLIEKVGDKWEISGSVMTWIS